MFNQFHSLAEAFLNYFDIELVATQAERDRIGRLRYRVYCEEFGYEPAEAFPDGREVDRVDDHSMHCLVTHRGTGLAAGCVRMICASFLVKDLMIDWRLGARWFMTWLTDGDVANNQLGWQWVAGTGTDTNPTRIFNPTLQSERFDPDGSYIRRWIPELRDVTSDEIHDPGPLTRSAVGYPPPIVDHHQAIRDFKAARGYR